MIKTTWSAQQNTSDAIAEMKNKLSDTDVKALLYFASSSYDQADLAKGIQAAFPDTLTFGCSTAGEITNGEMLENSVVAMAFTQEHLEDIHLTVVEDLSNPRTGVEKAFAEFESYFGTPMIAMDFQKYVGIVLVDGLSRSEEKLMDRISDLTDVVFTGGSAGDDLKFEKTTVYAQGKAYSNAAVLAILKPSKPFEIIKTQSLKSTGKKLTVTKANEETRLVSEFNHQPAARAYAEALGIPESELSKNMLLNPLGLMNGAEPFVRSPQRMEGQDVYFYCSIHEGMELHLLRPEDMIADTQAVVKDKQNKLGTISGVINFHCILRTLELKEKNKTQDYGALFADFPTIGFSTYGECYIGHINQTSIMIVFG